jgi:hypothetical protein
MKYKDLALACVRAGAIRFLAKGIAIESMYSNLKKEL